jgi:prepilin-type N-terminal cleavage/methylation domain-containing protein
MNGGRRLSPARRAARGFTMIEIMMAVVVFLTAAAGLVAFEHALMRSNTVANDITAATYIADYWLERGRVESLLWNSGATDLVITRTPLLSAIQTGIGPPAFSTGWRVIPASGPASRALGAPFNRYLETWSGTSSTRDYAEFCVQYRLTTLMTLEVLRMEVRVLWYKAQATGSRATAGASAWTCPGPNMVDGTGNPDVRYVNTVQFASTLWRNQVQ